jgi:hypothetical protein
LYSVETFILWSDAQRCKPSSMLANDAII